MCNVIAPHFYSGLKSDIGNQKFSLLIGECNDIMETKLLGIAIRLYSKGEKIVVSWNLLK